MNKTSEEYSLLYDYYGALLSKRQREVFERYHEENLSLSEIAEEFGVSRQAVHIMLGKATVGLENFEEKLGLIAKHAVYVKALQEIETKIDSLLQAQSWLSDTESTPAKDLRRIKKLIIDLDI